MIAASAPQDARPDGRGRFGSADPVRIVLLTVFIVVAAASIVHKSPTFDEPLDVYRGYRYLRTGDPAIETEGHPPGIAALTALPLFLALPRDSTELSPEERSWPTRMTSRFFAQDDRRPFRLFPLARGVVVLLAAWLGWLLYGCAASLYGRAGARLALALYALDPNVIANGRLATTDLGVALGIWCTILAILRWAPDPTAARTITLGAALGFALLTKFSALLLVPLLIPFAVILTAGRKTRAPFRRLLGAGTVALALAGTIVWGAHGFRVGTIAAVDEERSEQRVRVTKPVEEPDPAWYEEVPLPAPEYLHGIARQMHHAYAKGHTAYFRGENSRDGWKSYYPIVFLLKTPPTTLLLLLLALAGLATKRPSREEWVLLLFVAAHFSMVILSSAALGYRLLLPALPCLFVLAGRLTGPGWPVARWARARTSVLAGAIVLLALGTAAAFPHYLAYFSPLAGGSAHASRWVAGADLDWGQDLPGLARWLREHDVESVQLSYFGTVRPEWYGVAWTPIQLPGGGRSGRELEAADIAPGVYAVSVSRLVGLQSLGRDQLGVFAQLTPTAIIGHSILIYVVEA